MRLVCSVAVVLGACGGPSGTPSDAHGSDGPSDTAWLDAPPDGPLVLPDLTGAYTYAKASNTDAGDTLRSVAVSADGTTVAVGAAFEDGNGTSESDDSMGAAGAVYIYVRSGSTWSQQAYLKAEHPILGNQFGAAVALSADGNTLLVGAPEQESCATTVNGSQTDQGCPGTGAAYLFTRTGTTWMQDTFLKASNTRKNVLTSFGATLALSLDGMTAAVASPGDSSKATGIDGDQSDITTPNAGAVFVYARTATQSWQQQAYVKSSNTANMDVFAASIALSYDGSVMAVGAPLEDSNATGINGNEKDNSLSEAGAVYLFERAGTTWSQTAYVKASNSGPGDHFGSSVSLSSGGTTLAVGADGEQSNATGVDGDQSDDSLLYAGAAYVFGRSGTTWVQQAYVKSLLTATSGMFGQNLSLSANGFTLAVGANMETSGGSGLTTATTTGAVGNSGSVYTYRRTGNTWAPNQVFKASTPGASDGFASSLALSADAATLVVTASGEDSKATGIGGDETDDTAMDAGAAYFIQ